MIRDVVMGYIGSPAGRGKAVRKLLKTVRYSAKMERDLAKMVRNLPKWTVENGQWTVSEEFRIEILEFDR